MRSWRTYRLGDIVEDISMGPFGSNLKVDNFIYSGVPVIRGSNLNKGGFQEGNFVFVSEEKAKTLKRCLAYPDELVFTHRGTIGQVGIIPNNQYPYYLVSQSQMRLAVNKKYLNPKFLYYFFQSPFGQRELLKNTSQVGVPAIATPTKSLKEVSVLVPPLEEQSRIAVIFSSLDDKIELNLRMNKTLEAITQAIFKEWFVVFRFPGFDGELVDGLPREWRRGKLGEIIVNFDSKRVPLSSRQREKRKGIYPYYGAASIMDYIDDYLFDGTYLLMGEDGSVIDEKGYPILQYVWGKFWVNNHAHVIQGVKPFSTEYIYILLKGTPISNIVTGAVQPKINQGNLNSIKCIIPNDIILHEFNKLVLPVFERMKVNVVENKILSSIRDTLLPKLMTGKIKVA